jgi:hypothetical protein
MRPEWGDRRGGAYERLAPFGLFMPEIQIVRETHACPPEVQDRLTRAGGVNRFGEPNFRVVWNGSRLGWIGGWWTIRDDQGEEIGHRFEMRYEPKWLPPWDRWILETYRPPEWFGSPWLWDLQTTAYAHPPQGLPSLPALGPYPARGDYLFVTSLDEACAKCWARAREEGLTDAEKARILGQCAEREFLQATPRVADTLARMVRRNRERNFLQIRDEIEQMAGMEAALAKKLDAEAMAQAEGVQLSKERLEKIERRMAPAVELALARARRKLEEMTPEMRKAELERANRMFAGRVN